MNTRPDRAVPLAPDFVVASTLLLWLSTAIAASALWPIYQSGALVTLVAVAAAAGSAIAILGAVFRWSSLLVLLVSIAGYLALGVPVAVPERALHGVLPSLPGLAELATGTALSWKQLLTVTPPVGSYQGLLIPAWLLVFGSVTISLSVALRTPHGELGVLGPILLFLTALGLGPTRASRPLELSLGLTAAILLWLIWRRWYRRRAAIRSLPTAAAGAPVRLDGRWFVGFRPLAAAGLIMLLASATAVGASVLAPPAGGRHVLRSVVVQPFNPRDYVSPLSGFRSYWQDGRADETMLTVSGLPRGARIRLATLDTYDGIVFSVGDGDRDSVSGTFTRVPATFDQSALPGRRVTLRVTVGGYRGVWLPTVGQFERVDFAGVDAAELRDSFYYNDNGGTAAVVHPVSAGDRYTLRAVLPDAPTARQLSGLTPGTARSPRPTVLPDELSNTLKSYVKDLGSPGQRLTAMLEGLKAHGYVSHGVSPDEPPSRSGHAADRITQLLTDQRMIGDQEQYAVTAALMAGQLGFPSRVVLGFEPTGTSRPAIVRGSDISAWIEVDTAQFGWVAIDPTPPVRSIPAELPEEPAQVARPQAPVPPPPLEQDPSNTQTPPQRTQDDPAQPDRMLQVLLIILNVTGALAIVIAVLLAPFLAVILAKLRRRSLRRRAPSAIARISGGWQEFEDAVVDHGLAPPASGTRSEVAAAAGGERSLLLASVADRAVFAPEASSEDDAERVWRSVRELRTELGRGLTRWQRMKARISVRSLRGYSFRRLFKR